jgi:predicted RNA-binding protein
VSINPGHPPQKKNPSERKNVIFYAALTDRQLQRYTMAKPNYAFEKRQRELAKKKKKEEKKLQKAQAQQTPDAPPATATPETSDSPDAG